MLYVQVDGKNSAGTMRKKMQVDVETCVLQLLDFGKGSGSFLECPFLEHQFLKVFGQTISQQPVSFQASGDPLQTKWGTM